MNRKLTLPAFALAMLVGFSGCDLDVANPNQADRARALASPDDVETLISSAYQQYWGQAHYWRSQALAFSHMSSRHTATWGNFGMNDLGREPREALPNTPSYRWAYVFEVPWQDSYAGISASSDGLAAIGAGLEIGDGGARNPRAIAFAKFNQALSSCTLAAWFDQAFIIDETVDLAGDLNTVPYDQMMDYALNKFDEAITQARNNSFTLEDTWLNGNALSNNEFADVMLSYKARCRASEARSDAEAGSTDWGQVAADAAAGRELIILGEDASSDTPWWDGIKTLGAENATWHRMHYDWAGMADQSGNYQGWLALETQLRTPVTITTPDLRYPAQNVDGEKGLYHRYNAAISYRPERGTYRQSHYGDARHDAYLNSCSFCYFGPINEIIDRELRLYEAEAALRQGNTSTAVSIINETRVGNGGLTALTGSGTVPNEPGGGCVPRKRYDVQGRCGDLRDAFIYEHFEEIFHETGGLEFFHGRRFDILPANTALHMPIPASDLEVLQQSIYTFGGGGDASAPNPIPPNVVPGNLDSTLERVAYSLGRIEARREALKAAKSSGLTTR